MQAVDTLICAAHVVPVAPRGALAEHAVAVKDGRIVALLPVADAMAKFDAREVVRRSFAPAVYEPEIADTWQEARHRFAALGTQITGAEVMA